MLKLFMLFGAALAIIQLIKPLGLPGLKRRQDAWKLPLLAAGLGLLTVFVTAST